MMQNIRRILHVAHGFPPESRGGTEAYVDSLLGPQLASGLEPTLLHGSFEPRPEACIEPRDDLRIPAFRLHRADAYSDYWDKAHYPPARELFAGFLHANAPDLVHVHQWIRMTDDLVDTAAEAGIPTVVSLHDLYSSCPACFRLRPDDAHCERVASFDNCRDCVPLRGHETAREVQLGIELYAQNFRRELSRARRVLAATHATAALVTHGLGLSEDLVHILPLGYERRFADLARGDSGDAIRLAYWGNVTHRKGVQVLLAAMRQLASQRALGTLELHVFGRIDTEPLERELHDLAQGLPVTFHGRYEYSQLAALGVDLAVFPSTCFETYGFVLDEAFELGAPALVTDVGAFAERLRGAGFLVPPGDVHALADRLGRLLDHPDELAAARERIPTPSPTPEEHAALLLEHYEAAAATEQQQGASIAVATRRDLDVLRASGDASTAPAQRGMAHLP